MPLGIFVLNSTVKNIFKFDLNESQIYEEAYSIWKLRASYCKYQTLHLMHSEYQFSCGSHFEAII